MVLNTEPAFLLFITSLLVGLCAAIIFRFAGNQEKISRINNQIHAHIIELRLFGFDPFQVARSFGNILKNLTVYISYSLKPLIILVIPVLFSLQQLHLFFAFTPLKPGNFTVVTVKLNENISVSNQEITLYTSENLEVVSPPVRIPVINEVSWKIKATGYGKGSLVFNIAGRKYEKPIAVSNKSLRISATSKTARFYSKIVFFGSHFLPNDGIINLITVEYPAGSFKLFGIQMNWIIAFLILSFVSGAATMKISGVHW